MRKSYILQLITPQVISKMKILRSLFELFFSFKIVLSLHNKNNNNAPLKMKFVSNEQLLTAINHLQ
jgi:hypothetical protein